MTNRAVMPRSNRRGFRQEGAEVSQGRIDFTGMYATHDAFRRDLDRLRAAAQAGKGSAHADHADHQDASHNDASHGDSIHTDTAHTDHGHTDTGHGDTGHTDTGHGDAGHSDNSHVDTPHVKQGAPYGDHSDGFTHQDHNDVNGSNTASGTHIDTGPHGDHSDLAQKAAQRHTYSGAHGDHYTF